MANANLFQQYLQPVRSVADYTADMDNADSNRIKLASARLGLQQTQDSMADAQNKRNAIQQVFAQLGPQSTPLDRARALQRNPLTATEGIAAEKAINDAEHVGAQTGDLKAKTATSDYELKVKKADKAIADIAAFQTPEQARQSLIAHAQAGDIDNARAQVLLQGIPTDPAAFPSWQVNMLRGLMSAKDRLESQKLHFTTNNTGGAVVTQALDPLTGKPVNTTSVETTQSPDNIATNATTRHGQDLVNERAKETFNAPQYMETDAGLVALPKKLAPGQVAAGTPVLSAGTGLPLGKPLKDIPAAVNTAIIANSQAGKQIGNALTLLEGKDVGDPANGGAKGDKNATGFKAYLPQPILNKWVDPSGVATRAQIADIGSLKIHDRSGAAVTISESPRLVPFIPLATDDAETVKTKLKKLKREIDSESTALAQTYSKDQGYKPSPVLANTPTAEAPGGNPQLRSAADAILAGQPEVKRAMGGPVGWGGPQGFAAAPTRTMTIQPTPRGNPVQMAAGRMQVPRAPRGMAYANGGEVQYEEARQEPVIGSKAPVRFGGSGGGLSHNAILRAVDAIPAAPTASRPVRADPLNPRAVLAAQEARADLTGGGPAIGPGGPMEDAIPARLSNGEHVIDAATVTALGDGDNAMGQALLNALRKRVKGK